MLKHTFFALVLGLTAATASASPETAENWGIQASEIYDEASSMITGVDQQSFHGLAPDFEDRLIRFASTASYLGAWTDETQDAPDLGCIFRGMAEESELQLIALEQAQSVQEMKAALRRIATMADDAQSIAVASAHAGRTGEQVAPSGQCLSNSVVVDHILGASAD